MSRIIGCRDLHYAELVSDLVTDTKPTYKAPVAIPSLVSVKVTDAVEQSKFYSDDSVEQAFSKISAKEVTIELGHLSNDLEIILTGKTKDTNGVALQSANDTPKEIALLFRAPKSKNNDFRYVCLYKGTLTRTESEYATQEDKIESSNVTLTGTFIPCTSSGKMSAIADSEDTETAASITAWFTTVYGATMQP